MRWHSKQAIFLHRVAVEDKKPWLARSASSRYHQQAPRDMLFRCKDQGRRAATEAASGEAPVLARKTCMVWLQLAVYLAEGTINACISLGELGELGCLASLEP